jgi:hypothetical protein
MPVIAHARVRTDTRCVRRYAKVASAAYRGGKRALATLLLEHEPRAADQVPLLIGMKEDELVRAGGRHV